MLLVAALAAGAQTKPTVAVVDAVLPVNVDEAAVGPMTERVIEALLATGDYQVLDRGHVGSVLKELEFQLAAIADPGRVAAAGALLGAEYLLALKVDRLDGIFFLSAKLIEANTGQIIAQSSESRETPKVSVLVEMAGAAASRLGSGKRAGTAAAPSLRNPRIGLVTGSAPYFAEDVFNDSAWNGLEYFGETRGLEPGKDLVLVKTRPGESFEEALAGFAASSPDLVVCLGFDKEAALQKVAARFPAVRFAIIDGYVAAPNVRSITFSEKDGSFLAGVAAGLEARRAGRKTVGFIGGMDIPVLRLFHAGYVQGVRAAYPACEILTDWAGDFSSPDKGRALALSQYRRGAHVIYAAAGITGDGVFAEAVARRQSGAQCWVIGVDSDQYELGTYAPGKSATLTSCVKRTDVAAHLLARSIDIPMAEWGRSVNLGVFEGGIGLPFRNPNLVPEIASSIAGFERRIYEGKLVVAPGL